ncbi:retrovirus-related pol polyprotein from transposon tnt 1-94 [Gossypium australe]|uniref:Retrovirus-related pol polyprotein from transposon tnt 1-94 n=1 Tax=Gossypium australe TaxID=47621 RepID=A0A5B6V8S5_9ROSI|nr:retrovirus-related pol polyprotein from transposon tnt 1-94 [Gossypium australe]
MILFVRQIYMREVFLDAIEFKKVLDKIQYSIFTKPNICYSVNKLSQFIHNPSKSHLRVVK